MFQKVNTYSNNSLLVFFLSYYLKTNLLNLLIRSLLISINTLIKKKYWNTHCLIYPKSYLTRLLNHEWYFHTSHINFVDHGMTLLFLFCSFWHILHKIELWIVYHIKYTLSNISKIIPDQTLESWVIFSY